MFDETEDTTDCLYHVELIEEAAPPADMPGSLWHRYVIGRGESKIDGMKSGSMSEVRQHAEAVADDLNERANKMIYAYAARGKK